MKRMLIIDDDVQIRMLLKTTLENHGYEVIEADDGHEGLERYDAASIDLVITDLFMPGREGLETIRALRRTSPTVKIIAISGGALSGTLDFLQIAARLGAQRTLHKPFSQHAILHTVRDLLEDKH